MNGEELKKLFQENLEEHNMSIEEFLCDDYDEEVVAALEASLGAFELVSDERVGKDFDKIQVVYKFIDHDVFFAFKGLYFSEDGSDFDNSNIEIVEPVKITTIKYLRIKK